MIRHLAAALYWSRRSLWHGFSSIFGLLLLTGAVHAIGLWVLERDLGLFEAVWLTFTSVTTIGYGDFSAASMGGRITTMLTMVVGILCYTLTVGLLVEAVSRSLERRRRGMAEIHSKGHVLIINWPSEQRVRQLVAELRADAAFQKRDIVVVSDRIGELPPGFDDISFVYGSPISDASYAQANLSEAFAALVLNLDESAESDAVVASIVAVVERLNPAVRSVAECHSEEHKPLFAGNHCDAVVCNTAMANNILVQELQDPGVAGVLHEMSSNHHPNTCYSCTVAEDGVDYLALAHRLVDQGIQLIAVRRGETAHYRYADLASRRGDCLVYVAEERLDWPLLNGCGS